MENGFSFASVVYLFILVLVLVTLRYSVFIVPQSENWLIERLGRYHRKIEAGLHLLIPFFEVVRHKVSIQEMQQPPDPINAITLDNVSISIQLAIFYRIIDSSKTMYRIADLKTGIKTIVNGTVRSVIGKTELDGVQSNRRHIAEEIESELQAVSDEWGIKLTRVEITEVEVDEQTKEAMQVQLNAERKRRGAVTEAEGIKQATQLQADASLYSAEKEALAKRILADAEAYAVAAVSKAISEGGASAIEFEVKKLQAQAVQSLAVGNNTKIVLVPSDVLSSLSGTIGKLASKL
ncbi:HflC Membrane protease subunits, stomatin/prohibitin homologs [Burkholderiaceae bacterium]|jgi:regulator of protease activity HflC (stomatin/prohibitin superfamily)|nr:SPFH/Band 7/PHB domain protein [Limnohabitans sp.]MBP8020835.1 SPFH/Band 7/PHB domain protein [Limnohabitans sp.]